MSATPHLLGRGGPEIVTDSTEPDRRPGWLQVATSTDHKAIGRMYIATSLVFLALALTELVLMRIQLLIPEFDFMRPEIFDRLLSIYPITATLLFAIPLLVGLISFVAPLQVGARGVALPRLHQLSFWLYLAGAIALYATLLWSPSEAGMEALPPLSNRLFSPNDGVDGWIFCVGLCSAAFATFSISMLATLRNLRAPGMVWRRVPAFSWASRVISVLLLVISPVMLAAVTMLFIDRNFGGVFFDPGEGGAPVLYEHLAWFFFSGIYAAILVGAFGAISEILGTFSRQPPFAPRTVAASMAAFAALVPLAWMQNMYSGDIPIGFLYFTMLVALAAAVPFGMLLFNWIGTVRGAKVRRKAAVKLASASVVLITIGLAGELAQAIIPVGWRFGNTMVAWGDTHITLIGGALLGGFAALHYWFPKISGRYLGEGLGTVAGGAIAVGALLMGVSAWLAGFQGMAVDVYEYYDDEGLLLWNILTTLGAVILAGGTVAGLVNAASSYNGGTSAGPDPWGAGTLEWFAASPPPPHNFDLVPDVRSAEPLADIRDAVRERSTDWTPPPARSGGGDPSEPEPVGANASAGAELGSPSGSDTDATGSPPGGEEGSVA